MNILVKVLQAVIAHASKKEPGVDVLVLITRLWVLALGSTVDIDGCEVARELPLILGNEPPLWVLVSFSTFDK